MFRTSLPARRSRCIGFASSLALALALAGGVSVGVIAFAAPALAAKKPKDEPAAASATKTTYTKSFVDAYKQVEDVVKAAQDAAGAQRAVPLVQPLIDKISNEDERNVAGQLVVQVGLKLNDKKVQRQGLILQLDSGKVSDDRKALFNYYVGGISWEDKEYDLAQKYLALAFELGHRGDDIESLLASTYFERDQYDAGFAELKRMETVREAAGSALPDLAIRTGLQAAYDQGKAEQVADFAALLVKH